MIFQKNGLWKISGHPQKYTTFEEAQKVFNEAQAQKTLKLETAKAKEDLEKAAYEKEREEKLKQLAEDSTPYEIMIAKNICLICNLEPCECFTYTKKTEVGQSEDTKSSSS